MVVAFPRVDPFRVVQRIGGDDLSATYVAEWPGRPDYGFLLEVCAPLPPLGASAERRQAQFGICADAFMRTPVGGLRVVEDVGLTGAGHPYAVVERRRASTMAALRTTRPGGVLPWRWVVGVATEISHGLSYLHRTDYAPPSLIHRELNDSRITVDVEGRAALELSRFALVMDDGEAAMPADGDAPPVTRFTAPEQIAGGPLGPAVDIFALGVLMSAGLAGDAGASSAHVGAPLRVLARAAGSADVPDAVCELVERMISPNPACRPTAGDVHKQLATVRTSQDDAMELGDAAARASLRLLCEA